MCKWGVRVAKSEKQKLKLLYLKDILLEKTDEEHYLKMEEIINLLAEKDIAAERKSIYNDMEMLRKYGTDVDSSRRSGYRILGSDLETADVKALIDAVQSSRFRSRKKTRELIEKLKGLVSEYEAKSMRVNKALTEKIKSDNEMVLIAIDKIMEAIENNKQISFRYYSWTPDKEKKYSNEGKQRVVNPWDLCWDNTAYYCMTSTPENPTEARIFRVDKMDKVSVTNKDRTPEGVERFRDFNSLEFSEKHFSMFNGEMKKVTLCCDNNMANVIIDRFGTDVSMRRLDDDHFVVHIMVAVSKQFFGWLFGLGSGVKIVEPAEVVQQYKDMAKEILEQ